MTTPNSGDYALALKLRDCVGRDETWFDDTAALIAAYRGDVVNALASRPGAFIYSTPTVADDLLASAVRLVTRVHHANASLFQRRLDLNYEDAKALIDRLEAAGVIGPETESKYRTVLK